jgi:DnaB-like helicase C terminal domain/Toprim-like
MGNNNLEEKIRSIRDTIGGDYRKPDPAIVETLVNNLTDSHDALEYLFKRGLTKDTIKHFKLGYDTIKDAISIPIYKHGELVNIRYRHLDPQARQRYTQERGCEVWMYNDVGIQEGMKKGAVLIVEGEIDLMSVWQSGIVNVVSPASGKNSYGPWIELLDPIKKVYIAYDNDKPGRTEGIEMSNRIGVDKCFEVQYPDGIKDANDYFLQYTKEDYRTLIKNSKPYYKHQFSGVTDVLLSLKENKTQYVEFDVVPYVKFETDWVAVVSGRSNSGKTSVAMNIADDACNKDLPTLVLPYERGIRAVGQRFIQVRYRKQQDDFQVMTDEEWSTLSYDAAELPLYFSMPTPDEFPERIRRAKRLFNIKVCIIDHLDYFIRGDDKISKQADIMREIKELAQELQIIFIVVHHIRKSANSSINIAPVMEDLAGSGDIFKIAEVVMFLHKKSDGEVDVIIEKNKGPQGTRTYMVDMGTGAFEKGEYNKPKVDKYAW